MLADGTEASARANTPKTDEEILNVINDVIDFCKDSGQLDNTDLTLRDIQTVKESFYNTLKQSYHPRIKYPEQPKQAVVAATTEASNPS
jgi:membrane-associated HD superfamily phosphohydrolase